MAGVPVNEPEQFDPFRSKAVFIPNTPLRYYTRHGVVLLPNEQNIADSIVLNMNNLIVEFLDGRPIEGAIPIRDGVLFFRSLGLLVLPGEQQIIHLSGNGIQLQPNADPIAIVAAGQAPDGTIVFPSLEIAVNPVENKLLNIPSGRVMNLQTGEITQNAPVALAEAAPAESLSAPRGNVTDDDIVKIQRYIEYTKYIIGNLNIVDGLIRELANPDLLKFRSINRNIRTFANDDKGFIRRSYSIIARIDTILAREHFSNVTGESFTEGLHTIIKDFLKQIKEFSEDLRTKQTSPQDLAAYFQVQLEGLRREIIAANAIVKENLEMTAALSTKIAKKYRELVALNAQREQNRTDESSNRLILLQGREKNNVAYNAALARETERQRIQAAAAANALRRKQEEQKRTGSSQNTYLHTGFSQEPVPMTLSNSLPNNNAGGAGGNAGGNAGEAPAAALPAGRHTPAAAAPPPFHREEGAAAGGWGRAPPANLPVIGAPFAPLAPLAAAAAALPAAAGPSTPSFPPPAARANAAAAPANAAAARANRNNGAASPVYGAAPPANAPSPFAAGPYLPPAHAPAAGAGNAAAAAARAGNAGGAGPYAPPAAAARAGNADATAARAGNAAGAPNAANAAAGAGNNNNNNNQEEEEAYFTLPPYPHDPRSTKLKKAQADEIKAFVLTQYSEYEGEIGEDANIKTYLVALNNAKTIDRIKEASINLYEQIISVVRAIRGENNAENNEQGGGRRRIRSDRLEVRRRKTLKRKVKSHKHSKKTRGRK